MTFKQKLIDKWEKGTGHKHQGVIDMGDGNELPYYDHQFVEDLLKYVEKVCTKAHDEAVDIRNSLKECLT